MKTTDTKKSWLFLPSCDLFVITFHNEILGSSKKLRPSFVVKSTYFSQFMVK